MERERVLSLMELNSSCLGALGDSTGKELASNQYQSWRNRRNELLAQFTDTASRSPPVNLASVLAQCSASVKGLGLAELMDWSHLEAALLDLEKKRSAETKAKVDSLNK